MINQESDKLYNEEIDLGNGEIRKIASGLRGRVPLEDMQNRSVVILANLKPRNLRGWMSHGMVMCVNGEDGSVEPIIPPAGSQPGDEITIGDYPRTPIPEITSKKDPWSQVKDEMVVGDNCMCTYQKTAVWKTSKGEITTKLVKSGLIS